MRKDEFKALEKETLIIVRNNIVNAFNTHKEKPGELASELGISISSVHDLSRIENNPKKKIKDVQLSTLAKIAAGLNFPIDCFFTENMDFNNYVYEETLRREKEFRIDNEITEIMAGSLETVSDYLYAIVRLTPFLAPSQQQSIKHQILSFLKQKENELST